MINRQTEDGSPGACSTAHRSNRLDHWDGLMLDRSAVAMDNFHRNPLEQNGSDCVSPADNRCRFVLVDNDESCPTADLSNIHVGRPSGPAYSTGELLNTP